MKSLKFSPELVPLILSGSKTVTWRLFDDKNLSAGDVIELIARPSLKIFGKAKIIAVIEKPFGKLINTDMKGHEKFKNKKEMYATYGRYYKRKVNRSTPVKIVRFRLVAQF